MNTILKVDKLNISYANEVILRDVSFSIMPQEIVTLIGPNGAGKSSLIKAILGLIKINSGTIELAANVKIGYMPQKLNLDLLMPITVLRFLRLTLNDLNTINETLEQLKIAHIAKRALQKISGGELQRVLLARALLEKPSLLLLDEPTQGVDITGQSELYKIIINLKEHLKCSILLISHDLHVVMSGTDKVLCLNKHICCSGHPAEIQQHPEFLQLFNNKFADLLAIYTHKHNHQHDLSGEIE